MVPRTRFELATSPLPMECSTPEPSGQNSVFGAGEGNRTLIISLEGFCITTMLLPRLLPRLCLVGRAGFEPAKVEPPDLQSGPVGRLGNLPMCRVTDCNKHYPMLSSIFFIFFYTPDNI